MLTLVVAERQVDRGLVVGIGRVASSPKRVAMNRRGVRGPRPESERGIERRVGPQKCCSFR